MQNRRCGEAASLRHGHHCVGRPCAWHEPVV